MRFLPSHALPDLPVDIKVMIRDGVYALYTVSNEGVEYLLVTKGSEFYLLSASGALVAAPRLRDLADAKIVEPVLFADGPGDTATINRA
jgi:hypothetical protein